MSHTKEIWRLGRFTGPESYETVRETVGATDIVVDTENGVYVLAQCNNNFPEDAKANARRICACINACAGIPTDDLEQCPSGGLFHLADMANEVVKQRDELLVALGRVIENMDEGDGEAPGHSHYKKGYWDKDGSKCEWCEDWNNAKALIASVKGGAA